MGRKVSELSPPPEVIITSPLSRTAATSVAVFGNCAVPIIACELWRERSGRWPCERRRNRSVLMSDIPSVDLSAIPTEEDSLWTETRESASDAFRRAAAAIEFVVQRPERVVAVVSH